MQGAFAQCRSWGEMLMEWVMMWSTAGKGDGTELLPVAAGESSLAGMAPSKQAAPQRLPGERGPGCPPLPLPASLKTN